MELVPRVRFFYWKYMKLNMTADLAIIGGPTHGFYSGSCASTNASPKQYVLWWLLTFPVDTAYITFVRIYYSSKVIYLFPPFFILCPRSYFNLNNINTISSSLIKLSLCRRVL